MYRDGSAARGAQTGPDRPGSHVERSRSHVEPSGSNVERSGSYVERSGSRVEQSGSHGERSSSPSRAYVNHNDRERLRTGDLADLR